MLKSHYLKVLGALIFVGLNLFFFQNCAQNSIESQPTTQQETAASEQISEMQMNSKATVPPVVKTPPLSLISKWTYETYSNPIPSNIFAANDVYAPHEAQVDFVGNFSFKNQNYILKFTATINSTFEDPKDWQISAINLTKGGKKLTLEQANLGIAINSGTIKTVSNAFLTRIITIESSEKFLITWVAQINSKSKNWQNMSAVLVPRFYSGPWRGLKKWAFLEVKNKNQVIAEMISSKKVYKDSNYKNNTVELISNEISNNFYIMSNKQVWPIFNEIEVEANNTVTDAAKACKDTMNEYQFYLEVLKIPFPDIEKYPRKYYDMFHITYSDNFSTLCPRMFFSSHGGGLMPTLENQWLGPGAEITSTKNTTVVKNWDNSTSPFAHEVGHGLGFSDSYFNPIWDCPNFNENKITAEQVFFPDKTNCQVSDSSGDHNYSLEDSMVGRIPSFTVIHRALLGWLASGSVKTIYKSGTYDIVSQNNDLSNPTGPQLLQIVINDRNGDTEFLYIELANQFLYEKNISLVLPGIKSKLSALRKSGIRIFGTNWAYRDHNYLTSNEVSYFDYKDNFQPKNFDRYVFTMPDKKTLNFKWDKTDVKITQYLDAKNPNKAKVKVEYIQAPY